LGEGVFHVKVALTKARKLRHHTTDTELRLWHALRNRQVRDFKFKRQAPQGPYIIDFLCIEAKLIVEVDGGQHSGRAVADQIRTAHLEQGGYRVLHFWNNEVLTNLEGVLEIIADELGAKYPLTQPSPRGERAPRRNPCAEGADLSLGSGESVPASLGERALGSCSLAEADEISRDDRNIVPSPLGERVRVRGSYA
jgi:very-short-patch-repair endonuclease